MDAHLFFMFCQALAPHLNGAWLDKIQEPAPDVLSLGLFLPHRTAVAYQGADWLPRKAWLILRAERKDPFLFLAREKPTAPAMPSAYAMRLRKYATGRHIRACVPDFSSRRLWLLLGDDTVPAELIPRHITHDTRCSLWLLLDLREGASLRVLPEEEIPCEANLEWPSLEVLAQSAEEWRDWAVLTPALRRTLTEMEPLDRFALLEDLRLGGGDVFFYLPASVQSTELKVLQPACMVSAWPLPPGRKPASWPAWKEEVHDHILACLEQAGKYLVLARVHRENAQAQALPVIRHERRLERLLEKLLTEEQRLVQMCQKRRQAELLKAQLWRWPAQYKAPFVDAEVYGDDGAQTQERIAIDPRRTVREEMEVLFHTARRGQRGLEHVARRRKELEEELAQYKARRRQILAGGGTSSAVVPSVAAKDIGPELPKNVQLFFSSDGFVLLRGRDAKGNAAARRMAAPSDIWLHAEGGPGAHVIIKRNYAGQEIPDQTLDEAGGLAACKSWLREAAKARILYAEVRHIKPLRGAAPGTVRMDKIWRSREVPVLPELESKLASPRET